MFGINWIKKRWFQYKLNLWLHLQEGGVLSGEALKLAKLPATKALAYLEANLNYRLANVGLIVIGGSKKDSFTETEEQTELILKSMASLVPSLTEPEQTSVKARLQDLSGHNWGYVRRAADAALATIPKPQEAA